jgi:NADH-quinone oxidoreductase subunit D
MDLLEDLSGNRVHYSVNTLGGVKFDVSDKQADAIRKGMDFLEERSRYYLKVVTTDDTFVGRTRGIGTMTKEQAEILGAVGPTARASGVARDIRVDSPHASYPDFPVQIKTATAGDLEARFVVRINELFESYRLVREILDHMPAGELAVKFPRRVPAGEVISRGEAPRGELLYYISSGGSDKPERIKARTPSLCNWGTVTSVAVGHKLADMPMLLAGIDPCFSCNDRMITVVPQGRQTSQDGGVKAWTWEELRQYGIGYYK